MNKPIEIFVRHCNYSANSVGKQRPEWFSREKCWQNLLNTFNSDLANITVVFDGEVNQDHFLYKPLQRGVDWGIVNYDGGNDAKSFLNLLNYVKSLNLNDETIIYLLEDDYLHKPNFCELLLELWEYMDVDYATLYDHSDKYWLPMYIGLQSSIYTSASCHWRTTPSTTNTYACKAKTLIRDFEIHSRFCNLEKGYTEDHAKFTCLWQNGSNLVSPIPGWSTHVETQYLSPCVDWSKI